MPVIGLSDIKSTEIADTARLVDILKSQYGVTAHILDRKEPVSVLVQTILSQNTSDANSARAYQSLIEHFHSWESIAAAEVDTIMVRIKSGGLGSIKAERIKRVLNEVSRQRGKIELDFLSGLSLSDAEDWLIGLPGVGVKTARCVLLFSFGMPALPVDTHILRVSRRLGLIGDDASAEEAHRRLPDMVKPDDVLDFHLLVIEHGRTICTARKPRCNECPIGKTCISSALKF